MDGRRHVEVQQFRFQGNDVGACAPRLMARKAARLMTCSSSRHSRPGIGAQGCFGARRQAQAAQTEAGAVEFEEAAGEKQNIVAAIAQGRYLHGVDESR